MPTSFIDYQGRKILFIDYNGLKKKDDMLNTLYEAVDLANQSDQKLRTLIDITNSSGSPEWMDASKKRGKEIREKAEKTAIVSVSGVKKILLMGYNTVVGGRVKPFSNKEAALAYLAGD